MQIAAKLYRRIICMDIHATEARQSRYHILNETFSYIRLSIDEEIFSQKQSLN